MTSLFTKAAFAALIGLGSIATVPSVAAARDVGVRVEGSQPSRCRCADWKSA